MFLGISDESVDMLGDPTTRWVLRLRLLDPLVCSCGREYHPHTLEKVDLLRSCGSWWLSDLRVDSSSITIGQSVGLGK